jgi:5'(3')-deoxyribonucleotidase
LETKDLYWDIPFMLKTTLLLHLNRVLDRREYAYEHKLTNMKAIDKREDLKPYMRRIEADLGDLYCYINALNNDYFHALADPEKYRKMQPMYQPELPMTEALVQTYDVWAETTGVFVICQDLSKSWGKSTG